MCLTVEEAGEKQGGVDEHINSLVHNSILEIESAGPCVTPLTPDDVGASGSAAAQFNAAELSRHRPDIRILRSTAGADAFPTREGSFCREYDVVCGVVSSFARV